MKSYLFRKEQGVGVDVYGNYVLDGVCGGGGEWGGEESWRALEIVLMRAWMYSRVVYAPRTRNARGTAWYSADTTRGVDVAAIQ